MTTIHLGSAIPGTLYSKQFCNGRGTSNRFAITSAIGEVTCKSCLKRIAKEGAPGGEELDRGELEGIKALGKDRSTEAGGNPKSGNRG